MKKGIIVSLLAAVCLAATAVASASTTDVKRGASSKYEWEAGRHEVTIFQIQGGCAPATVLVHVKEDHQHNGGLRGENHCAAKLDNCGGRQNVRIHEGETIQCKVFPGKPLTAEACDDCEEVEGTVQVIKI
jgi:hypothetical protein